MLIEQPLNINKLGKEKKTFSVDNFNLSVAEKHSCGLICHASIKKATWLKIKNPNALTACINIAVG
jgi:hypothetical protein